jgi:tetratricopeptide (TPR) repeat protein
MGNMGRICHLEGKYPESMEFHKEEEKIALEIKDNDILAESLWNQSISLRRQGRYQDAVLTTQKDYIESDSKWSICCRIEELFNKSLLNEICDVNVIAAIEGNLKSIESKFAQGHWLGSAYMACLLMKAGQEERAYNIWNEILTKAQYNGFKLIELEMEQLKDSGLWK